MPPPRFPRDILTAVPRFVFGYESGIEVGIDAHLLAGHRVQRESRCHFSDATGTLRDHHKLNDDDDQEDDHTQDVVALDHELPEGIDHLPCVGFAEDQPRRGDVEGEAK